MEEFEWKTRGHDWPPDLGERLEAHGLVPEELETVMVGEASALAVDVELPDGLTVRRVDQLPERDAIVSAAAGMQRDVFGGGPSAEEMLERLVRLRRARAVLGRRGRRPGRQRRAGWTSSRAPSSPGCGVARRCPSGAAAASTAP